MHIYVDIWHHEKVKNKTRRHDIILKETDRLYALLRSTQQHMFICQDI